MVSTDQHRSQCPQKKSQQDESWDWTKLSPLSNFLSLTKTTALVTLLCLLLRQHYIPPPRRATHAAPAFDISQGIRVFLKDSWRIDLPDIQPEGLVYKTLTSAGVRNVPSCIVARDIHPDKYHATKASQYASSPWACHSDTHFIPHQHYRLTLDTVGRHLMTFTSSYEMVTVVRDALVGMISLSIISGATLTLKVFATHGCI
jgi:hypothetical protein